MLKCRLKNRIKWQKKTHVKELVLFCTRTLSKVYAKSGKFDSAYYFIEISNLYKDSLQNNLMNYKLDVFTHRQKTLEISLLKQENYLIESQAVARKSTIIILVAVLILLIILIYFLIKSRVQISRQRRVLMDLDDFKTRMLAIVSHDLRTPLASLSSILELVDHEVITTDDLHEIMPPIKEKVNSVMSVMDNLFQWAESNMSGHKIQRIPIFVSEAVRDVIDSVELNRLMGGGE